MTRQSARPKSLGPVVKQLVLGIVTLACSATLTAAEPPDAKVTANSEEVAANRAEMPANRAKMPADSAKFFKTYCVHCHGPDEQNAMLRLDTLPLDIGQDVQTADTWQKILNAVNSGAMPPELEEQPTGDEKAAFLGELSEKIVVARDRLADSGGVIVMRRLNRREYQNTIRDLLGVTIDVSDLPNDAGAGSFDTVGASLFFSPDQFERYLDLGRRALGEIIAGAEQRPAATTKRIEVEKKARRDAEAFIEKFRDGLQRYQAWKATEGKQPASDFGFLDEPRARRAKKLYDKNAPYFHAFETWPETETGTYFSQIHSTIDAGFSDEQPVGEYLLRVRLGAAEDAPANRRFVEFGRKIDVGGRTEFEIIDSYQITASRKHPQTIEIPVTLRSQGSRDFCFRQMRPNHKMANFRKNPVVPDPVLWVDWVEVEGPLVGQWPPENYRRIFFRHDENRQDEDYAREIITRFALNAFRGKEPHQAFVDRLVGIYQQHRETGARFERSVQEALAVVLASPEFLYLSEQGVEGELSDLELASRLSYFLWSAPPDEALLAAARDGSLSEPDQLRSQVDRMLDDPKSWEFVTGFTHQWLDLERIDLFQFDKDLYPDFDESTQVAAVDEVYHFVETLLRENISVRHFLESDFIVVNGLLAQYYGIDGITGERWRKVPAPPERGGLLGMAAVLAMGSDGERTSPVHRGAFVLRKLLNDPPPPAPANVPQLSRLEDEIVTTRQRLNIHQEEAQCRHCHRKIDPIGFGLENFDAAGHWRTDETLFKISYNKNNKRRKSAVGSEPVDASGQLYQGPEFADFYELRSLIADRTDVFSRGLIKALLEYSLGRRIGFSDEELVDRLHRDLQREQYGMRSLIHGIAQSEAFRKK